MAQNITLLGASYADVPAVELPKTGGGTATFVDVTPTTAGAADVASGKLFFDALGVLTQGTASGGGGASNVVTGTFKGTTTGAAMDVDLAYTGNGYPIAVMVFPEGGMAGNSTYWNLIQRYATGVYAGAKRNVDVAPNYQGVAGDNDSMSSIAMYKNSTSAANNYTSSYAQNQSVYNNADAETTNLGCVHIRSKTKMSVYIAGTQSGTTRGFAANITYRYWVIYSE